MVGYMPFMPQPICSDLWVIVIVLLNFMKLIFLRFLFQIWNLLTLNLVSFVHDYSFILISYKNCKKFEIFQPEICSFFNILRYTFLFLKSFTVKKLSFMT